MPKPDASTTTDRSAPTPGPDDLWFIPLGGSGEIGMNFNLYGHAGHWLIVDCGVTFSKPDARGPHIQMADPAFIAERRDAVAAMIITHAHEDHVGAVAHLWRRLRCPVYTTPFCAEILKRKLAEAHLLGAVPLHVVRSGTRLPFGVFQVEWIALTHSTPESQALLIETPAGKVFHTGDWKLDADPVVGPRFDEARYRALAEEDVLAMVCDSTNAMEPGRSLTEGELFDGLKSLVEAAPARVVVGCFGSNVARLHTLARVARETGRYAGLLGRSLRNYYTAARSAGIWDEDLSLVDPEHLGYLPRNEVLAIATGSQGEPRAALQRLAAYTHPDVELEPGDTVILSSRVIPGNEREVAMLIRRLREMKVHVVTDEASNRPIHASGHPGAEELRDMYGWVRPQIAVPVHGEADHMRANAAIAREAGVPRQMLIENGDLVMLAPVPGVRRRAVHVGRLGLEQGSLMALAPATPPPVAAPGKRVR